MNKIWDGIKAFFKAIWAMVSDKDWDADAQKFVGFSLIGLGISIMSVCLFKWSFDGQAPMYGSALITLGAGLIGWRGHTDV